MGGIAIRRDGRAGRITLNRPEALNALTHGICRAIDAALIDWADDPSIALVVIDAAGDRAFCAGGDIAELYASGSARDFASGQTFWRDEYRMNARIGGYSKPVISLVHGLCMGGGVGVACHASHRIVGATARIAMPECAIGLVPDAGGSALLARAPGRLGAFVGLTGRRMGPADAILSGFAECFIPEERWPDLIAATCESGDVAATQSLAVAPPPGDLAALRPQIDRLFRASSPQALRARLASDGSDFAREALLALDRASPLSIALTLAMLDRLGPAPSLHAALELEFRVTFRAQQHTDFLEGVRAMIIDKDRNPRWRHAVGEAVPEGDVAALLAPLGAYSLKLAE
jgi:enoyl-CoA hydratase/carnithine racemase